HDRPGRLTDPPCAPPPTPSAPPPPSARPARPARPATDGPGKADPRRCVQLTRDPVGADSEQRVDGGVVRRRPRETGRLEPRAVGELQATARSPDVAEIERAVPARARLLERGERAGETGRLPP